MAVGGLSDGLTEETCLHPLIGRELGQTMRKEYLNVLRRFCAEDCEQIFSRRHQTCLRQGSKGSNCQLFGEFRIQCGQINQLPKTGAVSHVTTHLVEPPEFSTYFLPPPPPGGGAGLVMYSRPESYAFV